MNISLTPELERWIEQKVESGRYSSASEVVREALRLFEEHELLKQRQIAAVQEKIDRGLRDLDEGRVLKPDEVWEELRRARNKRK
jgi:antitoxin ParD1/3/4